MTTSTRDKRGRWQPGATPNPKGRKPGSGRVARLRRAIEAEIPEIVARLVEAAKGGDIAAARLLVERAIPQLRAAELPVAMSLPRGASLADLGHALMQAAGDGTLTPTQAAALLAGLGSLARVVEVSELEHRIAALEGKPDE